MSRIDTAYSGLSADRAVEIPSGPRRLNGILKVPADAQGVIVFAHCGGSGRFSPRNQLVARVLGDAGLATLLLDLLENQEAQERDKVFDIELLAHRLQSARKWLNRQPDTSGLRLGYFGASTGAAAALVAAACHPATVDAVVCRGGRPDLAGDYLTSVQAPTLLIVGGEDVAIRMNRKAFLMLRCLRELAIVARATHLFDEPGTLEEVAELAKEWFLCHLNVDSPVAAPQTVGV